MGEWFCLSLRVSIKIDFLLENVRFGSYTFTNSDIIAIVFDRGYNFEFNIIRFS